MLECPANYFGKGENYILPENPEIIREFEKRFQQWEQDHPEDPTGEIALAHAKSQGQITKTKVKSIVPQLRTVVDPDETIVREIMDDEEAWVELELTLPREEVRLLKNYAKLKRRRPRDLVISWIHQFCKL